MTDTNPPQPSFSANKLVLPLILLLIFYIGLLPVLLYGYVLWHLFNPSLWWHLLLIPALIYIGVIITIQGITLIPALITRLFHITYTPGHHAYTYDDPDAFKWIIICSLYTPGRKIFEILPLARTRTAYYRLLGMHIGHNTLIGGVIKDPCLTSFGDNCTMGEYAIIYGHIQNMQHETIDMARVTIGNNCVIGAGAILMPGVTLQDNTTVAAGALVPKNTTLYSGKTYGGIPAHELTPKPPQPTP